MTAYEKVRIVCFLVWISEIVGNSFLAWKKSNSVDFTTARLAAYIFAST